MARTSMTTLIAQTRNMLWDYAKGNPNGTIPQTFSDNQIQTFLDTTRTRLENQVMTSSWNRIIWQTEDDNLEPDDSSTNILYLADASGLIKIDPTTYTVNVDIGEFKFTVAPTLIPSCYGYSYDLYAAAALGWFWLAGNPAMWKGDYGNRAMQMYELCLSRSKPITVTLIRPERLADLYTRWTGTI